MSITTLTIDIDATKRKSKRGFASMTPEKKREIASKGGKAAHALGTAHKWTSEEAQAAGRKGGSISRRRPKTEEKS
jgi:general stress protein YciG